MSTQKTSLKGNKVLFIAYFYPPVDSTGVPGAMRTVKLVRNLDGQRFVLTTNTTVDSGDSALGHLEPPIDGEAVQRVECWDVFKYLLNLRSKLKNLVGRDRSKSYHASETGMQQVFKSTSDDAETRGSLMQRLKDFVYHLCYFPDQAGPWILPAFLAGRKLVRERDIDVVFATGSPWSSLIIGYLVSRSCGIPLIADFRDPWIGNPFHHSKGRLLDRWSERLERRVVRHASLISLNTEPLMEDFRLRYPDLPESRFFVMPNSFDPIDFESMDTPAENPDPEWLTLCHAGFLYGVRDPAVLLEAIQHANSKLNGNGRKIRFRQIGKIELAYDIRERFAAMIDEGSLLLDSPRPYVDCLHELGKADWVVNVQPATRSQVPSKLYDYLALNRPIINITPRDGALGRLISEHQFGLLFGFDEEVAIQTALLEIAAGTEPPQADYTARQHFDCRQITRDLSFRIDDLLGTNR